MPIAVIIPARDAERVLPRTLEALSGASEVVVVDNGSRDGTAAVAVAHGATVVHEPRPSRPRARNAGAAATTADRLAFLDADCRPQPGWLEALDAALDDHALVGGRIDVETSAAPSRLERFDAGWRFRQERTIAGDGWSVTANLAVRRELFHDLGGFDERYEHAGEDVDFCLRAAHAFGIRTTYCADAVVVHGAETRLARVLERGLRQGHGNAQLHAFTAGRAGRREWLHPRPIVSGDWALRRLDLQDEEFLKIARAEYAARWAGSLWGELALAISGARTRSPRASAPEDPGRPACRSGAGGGG